jgi:hypothetical protein
MKILLDTNIIIHRETIRPKKEDIGKLFWWLDKIGCKKCIHRVTIDEITKLQNKDSLRTYSIKLESYHRLPTEAPLMPELKDISSKYDSTENDVNDTILLNELFCDRVDILITEDRKIHQKAFELGIDDRVYKIDSYLEKVISEYPELLDYPIPTVKKEYFGALDLQDEFFDTFKEDYDNFPKWFNSKSDETAYVCRSNDNIVAFLYIKLEDEDEPYPDITPQFPRKKRLKIGTLKVELNGFKLGERLLKMMFDNALNLSVEEIYVTIFQKRIEQKRLIKLLEDFGFQYWGTKKSESGIEDVYTRNFIKRASIDSPLITYPFMSNNTRKFLVPIYPKYHTELFPDSILRTESPLDFIENEPHRNAISKVYICRSLYRKLRSGDIVIFYRTKYKGPAYYTSVITTIGIVENVITDIKNETQFISYCRRRSIFSDKELIQQWNYKPFDRPFILNFLYIYSLPKSINLKRLIELGIIQDTDSAPRGFEEISHESFMKIIKESGTNESIIID